MRSANEQIVRPPPIYIPTPRIIVNPLGALPSHQQDTLNPADSPIWKSEVYAQWFSQDLAFLDFNPRYFLYRYKKNRKRRVPPSRYLNRFVHAPHLSLDGVSFFGGDQTMPDGTSYGRKTEFTVSPSATQLTLIDFAPMTYFKPISWTTADLPTLPGVLDRDFPIIGDPRKPLKAGRLWRPTGNANASSRAVFKLAIAIENPDWTSTNKQARYMPGPFSDTFVVEPVTARTLALIEYTIGYAIRVV